MENLENIKSVINNQKLLNYSNLKQSMKVYIILILFLVINFFLLNYSISYIIILISIVLLLLFLRLDLKTLNNSKKIYFDLGTKYDNLFKNNVNNFNENLKNDFDNLYKISKMPILNQFLILSVAILSIIEFIILITR
jgi:hypothetical protein